jgi:hypothetical protein
VGKGRKDFYYIKPLSDRRGDGERLKKKKEK